MSELLFASSRNASSLSRGVKEGRLRRLARGLYTADLRTPAAELIGRNWQAVVAHHCPGAIVGDRSAPLCAPDSEGFLFLVHPRPRPLVLPGLTIVPRKGAPPLDDDLPLPDGLYLSSRPRALLENLRDSRAVKGRPRRTLTQLELHQWVARLRRSEGVERLNAIRDRARELAPRLGLEAVFPQLDELIGAALGTRELPTADPGLAAAQQGLAYDERRARLFELLAAQLSSRAPTPRPVLAEDRGRQVTLPFFEAYFSNFIEGTEFSVDEAARIVFGGELPAERPEDAHDVLGTYQVLVSGPSLSRRPASPDQLLELLLERHARILAGRPDKRPGQLKVRANRAGSTEFVAPHLVRGTLVKGFEFLQQLDDPFARAVFTMFLVAEVHPFDDGNGRVARVMMTAELVAESEHRIIIPTVFRNEYLGGLRALTHNQQSGALIRVLDFAQRYTAQIDFSTVESARRELAATHAFVDPNEALARGVRLTLPSALGR